MKGYRTLLANAGVIVLGALLPWAAGVDWTQYVSPQVAALIVGLANIGLRLITTTPVASK